MENTISTFLMRDGTTSFIDQYSEKSFNVSFSPIYFSVYNVPSPNILVSLLKTEAMILRT